MKKTLIILSLILAIGLTATMAYAQTSKVADKKSQVVAETNARYDKWTEWHNEKMEWKKSQIDEAIKNEIITEEEAKAWNKHLDEMQEFHKENGPMPGGCHGWGHGWSKGHGRGLGMMKGSGWGK